MINPDLALISGGGTASMPAEADSRRKETVWRKNQKHSGEIFLILCSKVYLTYIGGCIEAIKYIYICKKKNPGKLISKVVDFYSR